MKCPCGDCENKGCGSYHSQCKDYLDWKKFNDSIRSKRQSDVNFNHSVKEIRIKGRVKKRWER